MAEYIERQKVFDSLPSPIDDDRMVSLYGAVADFMVMVSAIPAADVVQVRPGEWRIVDDGIDIGDGTHMECSECHVWNKNRVKTKFCPHCGAKMDSFE